VTPASKTFLCRRSLAARMPAKCHNARRDEFSKRLQRTVNGWEFRTEASPRQCFASLSTQDRLFSHLNTDVSVVGRAGDVEGAANVVDVERLIVV
jgi:hypothetical protein